MLVYVPLTTLAQTPNHDIRIADCISTAPKQIPLSQVVEGQTYDVSFKLANVGIETPEKVILKVVDTRGNELASKTINWTTSQVVVPFTLPKPYVVGAKTEVIFKAEVPGVTDATPRDNIKRTAFEITENTFANDLLVLQDGWNTDTNKELGSDYPVTYGQPYLFTKPALIQDVAVIFSKANGKDTKVGIYKFNITTLELGEKVAEVSGNIGTTSGIKTFGMNDIRLQPGYYLFTIDINGYVSYSDIDPIGTSYIVDNGKVTARHALYGNFPIRVNLSKKPVWNKDAAASPIKGVESGFIYTDKQEFTVGYFNNGSEPATMKCFIKVDDTVLYNGFEITLQPGESKEYAITSDFSQPGRTYKVETWTEMEGDENPENNKAIKEFTTTPLPDAYHLDFEWEERFEKKGFKGGWMTTDPDGVANYGESGFKVPQEKDPSAFIAYPSIWIIPILNQQGLTTVAEAVQPHAGGNNVALTLPGMVGNKKNRDLLISPKVKLPQENAKVSLWAKTANEFTGDGKELFRILVSETDTAYTSFKEVLAEQEVPEDWTQYEADLSSYADKEVHVAIERCSPDRFIFLIDDIVISQPENPQTGIETDVQQEALRVLRGNDRLLVESKDALINKAVLYSLTGNELWQKVLVKSHSMAIPTQNLSKGVYLLRVVTNKGTQTIKFALK